MSNRARRTVLWGVFAAIATSIVLAPILTVGWCNDAAAGGTSECFSEQRSVLGVPTNVWIWLGALALIAFVVVFDARTTRRRR